MERLILDKLGANNLLKCSDHLDGWPRSQRAVPQEEALLNANNSEGDLPVASRMKHSVPNCTLIPMSQKIPSHLGLLIPRQCKFAMGTFVY